MFTPCVSMFLFKWPKKKSKNQCKSKKLFNGFSFHFEAPSSNTYQTHCYIWIHRFYLNVRFFYYPHPKNLVSSKSFFLVENNILFLDVRTRVRELFIYTGINKKIFFSHCFICVGVCVYTPTHK